MVALAIMPAVFISGVFLGILMSNARQHAFEQLDLKSSQIASAISSTVDATASRMLTLAHNSDLVYGAESALFGAQAAELMQRFRANAPIVDRIDLVNRTGQRMEVVPSSASTINWQNLAPDFFGEWGHNENFEPWKVQIVTTPRPALAIAVPLVASLRQVEKHTGIIGYAILTIAWSNLRPEMIGIAGNDTQLEVFDSHGVLESAGAVFPKTEEIIELVKPIATKIQRSTQPGELRLVLRVKRSDVERGVYQLVRSLGAGLIAFTCIVALLALFVSQRLGQFIQHMQVMVEAYSNGRYDQDMPRSKYIEFQGLSSLLRRMGGEIQRQIEEAKAKSRLEAELDAARSVQMSLFPPSDPCSGLDYAFRFTPASQTSGDWLGYYYNPASHRLQIFITDVTGHGMSAALMSGVGCGALYGHEFAASMKKFGPDDWEGHLRRSAEILNGVFQLTGGHDKMITMSILSLHLGSGHLAVLNAGHPHPWIIGRDDRKVLGAAGSVLGLDPQANLRVGEYQLRPGDLVFAYTDGLVENAAVAGHRLKPRVIEQALRTEGDANTKLAALFAAGQSIWGSPDIRDDVTAFLLRWDGSVTTEDAASWYEKRRDVA